MGNQTGFSWWAALRLGKRVTDSSDDLGDMGTAFGLDASMGPSPHAGTATEKGRPQHGTPAPAEQRRRRSGS